jgi:hypothetical protein
LAGKASREVLRLSAHLPDTSMVAVRVGEVRRVIAAAPFYLAKHPRIDEPDDLAKQQIIAITCRRPQLLIEIAPSDRPARGGPG